MEKIDIGIIGGSGFYNMMELEDEVSLKISTPFGEPSCEILTGSKHGRKIAFIARHGKGHMLNPSEVNYRANIFALKTLGVKSLVSVTAVGSLKEELKPRDLLIPDQFFDNTFKRDKTFFEKGIVAHVSMADPVCPKMAEQAYSIAKELGLDVHKGGTYFNMEGPQFSSKAESAAYRQMGFDVIGMTQAVEAKLAKEAEMCFLSLAFITDYDCWHADTAEVTVDMVVGNLQANIKSANSVIDKMIQNYKDQECVCNRSLENAIMSDTGKIPFDTLSKLEPLICKYVKK